MLQYVNIGSGNDLVPTGNKPLLGRMSTQISIAPIATTKVTVTSFCLGYAELHLAPNWESIQTVILNNKASLHYSFILPSRIAGELCQTVLLFN